jgi:tRNA G10  N-methylase Trm11
VTPILSALVGNNADLFPRILELYVKPGSVIADVTWGKGAFWSKIDTTKYDLRATDLLTGTDFRQLPYADHSLDALVLDPPYLHGGDTVHPKIDACYNNGSVERGHESVVRLYCAGILEATRVLKKKTGILILKCQDDNDGGNQRYTHMEMISLMEMLGFRILDLFVLMTTSQPMMRYDYQLSARKNHSYFLVGKFRR